QVAGGSRKLTHQRLARLQVCLCTVELDRNFRDHFVRRRSSKCDAKPREITRPQTKPSTPLALQKRRFSTQADHPSGFRRGQQRSIGIDGLQARVIPTRKQFPPTCHLLTVNSGNPVTLRRVRAQRQMNRVNVLGNLLLDCIWQSLLNKTVLFCRYICQTENPSSPGTRPISHHFFNSI